MTNESRSPSSGPVVPIFGDLDSALRDDPAGEYLLRCLESLQDARAEMTAPARTDEAYRHEQDLMDGALRAADQVLRSVWASFHPRPAARRQSPSL